MGNFGPEHSTENHIARAFTNNGHDLSKIQEGDATRLAELTRDVKSYDLVAWTRTRDLSNKVGHAAQMRLIYACRRAGVKIIGLHLDLWWNIGREDEILTEPFFRVDALFSADGGHQDRFEWAGVNHIWFPPAISEGEAVRGNIRNEYVSDIAFVGSHQGYHEEHKHRFALVNWLRDTYGSRVKFWPQPGKHAVRGKDLQDLYASAKVLVGDSCLVPNVDGSPMTHYISDRVPETVGRGGFLLHPRVEGVIPGLYTPGKHLGTWTLWEWGALKDEIDFYLDNDDVRSCIAEEGQAHVLENHTYEVRVRQVLEAL